MAERFSRWNHAQIQGARIVSGLEHDRERRKAVIVPFVWVRTRPDKRVCDIEVPPHDRVQYCRRPRRIRQVEVRARGDQVQYHGPSTVRRPDERRPTPCVTTIDVRTFSDRALHSADVP